MSLLFTEARAIADKAVELLCIEGQHACICLCGLQGEVIVHFRMNATRPFTFHVAQLKAQQAAHTGKTTRDLRDLYKSGARTAQLLGIDPAEAVPFAGGVPIYNPASSALLGGIGISNLAEDQDERFALAAVKEAGFMVALL